MSLIVNLDEFSELCGVTSETMRAHVRGVEGEPVWLVERGDKGRGYKIEAEGGLAWWKSRLDAHETASAERRAALQQLRFEHLGDAAEGEDALSMSGRQRREEYAAVVERIKLRRMMGELVEVAPLEAALSSAVVELRRQLMMVPAEFAAGEGLTPEQVKALKALIGRALESFVGKLPAPGAAPPTEAGVADA